MGKGFGQMPRTEPADGGVGRKRGNRRENESGPSPEHEVNMKMREKKLRRKKKEGGEIPYMQSNTHVPLAHAQSRTLSRSH